METDFDKTMSDIEQTMTGTVEKMEMADEAKEAAQATIKAYCDAIRSMTGEAGSAAEAVANAAASHLKTTPTTTPTATTVAGHANGTLSAQEDVYIAGEKGPELIIGARGSEVFPTQETERILAAVNSAENATNAPEPTASPLPENDLPEGMEAVKEYSYLTADGQGSDAQPTGIEYVEPEVQAQTTEEAAPTEEAPVNTTAPAASDAQQEAPASSSDAPSIGETVKRIILEINGSGTTTESARNCAFLFCRRSSTSLTGRRTRASPSVASAKSSFCRTGRPWRYRGTAFFQPRIFRASRRHLCCRHRMR